MVPTRFREKGLSRSGFRPLPHPNHPEAGWSFPTSHRRDQEADGQGPDRFDLGLRDIPDRFPWRSGGPSTDGAHRPGDVRGAAGAPETTTRVNGICIQLKAARGTGLMLTPFASCRSPDGDRASERPSSASACFDVSERQPTGAAHMFGDFVRQAFRHRSRRRPLRGVTFGPPAIPRVTAGAEDGRGTSPSSSKEGAYRTATL